MSKYIFVLGALLVFAAGSTWLQRGLSFQVLPPAQTLASFPREIDGWVGADEEVSDGVANILDAHEMLSVRFSRGLEGPVFLHASTWIAPDSVSESCPHHPNICYRGNGWTPGTSATIPVALSSGDSIPVQMVQMNRGDQKVVVAFSYRMGDDFFADEVSARSVQLSLFGNRTWPAVTKFMLQTPHISIDAAKPTVEFFTKSFYDWHDPAPATSELP